MARTERPDHWAISGVGLGRTRLGQVVARQQLPSPFRARNLPLRSLEGLAGSVVIGGVASPERPLPWPIAVLGASLPFDSSSLETSSVNSGGPHRPGDAVPALPRLLVNAYQTSKQTLLLPFVGGRDDSIFEAREISSVKNGPHDRCCVISIPLMANNGLYFDPFSHECQSELPPVPSWERVTQRRRMTRGVKSRDMRRRPP